MQISQYNTFYFIRYAHFKYTKCLTHRNNGMCKKDPFFKKNTNFTGNSRIVRIKNAKFSRNYFYMNSFPLHSFYNSLLKELLTMKGRKLVK